MQAAVTPQLKRILPLADGAGYKYLGILENNVFDVTQMKLLIQQQFLWRSKTNSIKFWKQSESNQQVCCYSAALGQYLLIFYFSSVPTCIFTAAFILPLLQI